MLIVLLLGLAKTVDDWNIVMGGQKTNDHDRRFLIEMQRPQNPRSICIAD